MPFCLLIYSAPRSSTLPQSFATSILKRIVKFYIYGRDIPPSYARKETLAFKHIYIVNTIINSIIIIMMNSSMKIVWLMSFSSSHQRVLFSRKRIIFCDAMLAGLLNGCRDLGWQHPDSNSIVMYNSKPYTCTEEWNH